VLHYEGQSVAVAKARDTSAGRQAKKIEGGTVTDTPWNRRSARQKADRQERSIAQLPGGKKQVNSGRKWFSKRDNRLGGFLVEARTTESGRYCIERKEWEDIVRDAHKSPPGLLPAMMIDLGPHRLIVMELSTHLDREQRLINGDRS
jgi:hypothetical protein